MRKTAFILLVPALFAVARGQAEEPAIRSGNADSQAVREAGVADAKAVRAEARSAHNLFVGIGPMFSVASVFEKNGAVFFSPGAGLSLGYRRHFRKRLGFKFESQIAFGPTHVGIDSTIRLADGSGDSLAGSDGWGGQTLLMNAGGALIIGPFGRFNFEPGLGFAWGRHTVDSIGVAGSAGDVNVSSGRNMTAVNYSLALSLSLGKRDEYCLRLGDSIGFDPDPAGGPEFLGLFYLNVSYAFQIPRS